MKTRAGHFGSNFLLCVLLMCLAVEAGYAREANISQYPSRPISLIYPTPPGGGGDTVCRVIAKAAEKFLGQPIVVMNKPGGSSAIATAAVVSAKPDGYTIGYTSHLGLFLAPLMAKVPYDPVKDLRQIIQYGATNVSVTVQEDSPFKGIEDIIAYARQNPKKLTYGSAGTGTLGNLVMDQIAQKEKVQFTHIPFKGSAETQAALLGGHILVGTGDFNYSLIEAGQIKLLFLIVENTSSAYPHTPIIKDLGYDIPCATPMTIACPRAVPEKIVKKLEDAFTRTIKEPAFVNVMRELRYTIVQRNSKELADYVAASYGAYAKVLKEMGFAK